MSLRMRKNDFTLRLHLSYLSRVGEDTDHIYRCHEHPATKNFQPQENLTQRSGAWSIRWSSRHACEQPLAFWELRKPAKRFQDSCC